MAQQPGAFGRLVQHVITASHLVQALNTLSPTTPPTLPAPPPPDPMAGFAAGPALYRYAMQPGGFFLGHIHEDHGATFRAGMMDDRHVFVVAGSRAGKGVTFSIPNALRWPGPLFMIDPKGEAASICALRRASPETAKGTGTSVRRFVGQRVAVLDPLGQVRGPARAFRVSYNPLADIDMTRGGGVRQIQALVGAIIQPEEGNAAHFGETAETLLAGTIEAVKLRDPKHLQTLPQCRMRMLAGFEALREFLLSVDTPAALAQEAATLMSELGGDEWGSMRSTLSRNLKWLAEPDMAAHLAPSAFSLRRAVQEGWSIFVALPPEEMTRFRSWLRAIVRIMLDAKMAGGFDQRGIQTLCLLDEFPTLGHFGLIEDSAGYMAGFGLKLVPIIQNIGQVQKIYTKNWETFLGNAGAIIAFSLNDLESERYVADRLGRLMVTETTRSSSESHGSSGGSLSASSSTARHERPVRFPNEIHEQGARETGRAFVIPASGKGFTVRRVPYTNYPDGTFDHPDFIAKWESRNWRA